eukprot:6183739-Heterocapsa_arctica.AAC.1
MGRPDAAVSAGNHRSSGNRQMCNWPLGEVVLHRYLRGLAVTRRVSRFERASSVVRDLNDASSNQTGLLQVAHEPPIQLLGQRHLELIR